MVARSTTSPARKLCRNGATDREIADILGVCVRTFYRWRAGHDAFAEALTAGKELADDRNAVWKHARKTKSKSDMKRYSKWLLQPTTLLLYSKNSQMQSARIFWRVRSNAAG